MTLYGKTAIVTGGSRGIGRAICKALSDMGANVVVGYSGNAAEAEVTRSMCANAIAVQADVADAEACQRLFAACEEAFGPPDILVNNAGVTRDGLLMRMSEEDYDRVLDINLKGAFHCTKLACRPMLKKKGGRIVNITSVVGLTGNAGQVNYAASKAGLIGLTKSAAQELAPRGITVNAVAPGFIETDMTASLSEEVRRGMMDKIPLNRFGGPQEVAAVVAFLCSQEAGYVTGQVLPVDGGMVMG